jgi:S1-C subfamily serine protease
VADDVLGSVLSAASVLIAAWALASIFIRLPFAGINQQIQGSTILTTLTRTLPPAPGLIARLEQIIAPSGFPRVFAGIEPSPAAPVTGPTSGDVTSATTAGRATTVRIEGAGCGGLVEGSGFVVAPGMVATNAHVVAGIAHPMVIDSAGEHAATVVSFDPNLDFALLRTSGLAGAPLVVSPSEYPRGTTGAVLGYPGGGPFTVSPAAILDEQTALGRNIYGSGLVHRQIYALQVVVRPGNSGGPFIAPDGTVVGVVFAASANNDNVGYALTSAEVRSQIINAGSNGVSTGGCASE